MYSNYYPEYPNYPNYPEQHTKSFSKTVYKDAATFGKTMSFISAIISTIIGVILIIVGLFLVFRKSKYTSEIQGAVVKASPTGSNICTNKNNMYNCSFEVDYTLNGDDKTVMFNNVDTSINYTEGKIITLYYNPDDPNDIKLEKDNTKVLGWIMLLIAILMITISWLWNYLVNRNKFLAATEGVATGISVISMPFRK
jgi:hypothetical protein